MTCIDPADELPCEPGHHITPRLAIAATALVVALVELACRIPIRTRPDDRTCDDCPVLRHLKR